MKKYFLFVFLASISTMGIISTSSAQGEPVTIGLLSPPDHQNVSACSYFDPPVFQWETNGIFKSIEVQFSKDNFSTSPLKLKGKPGVNQIASTTSWKKIFLLPGNAGGTVSWKVIGTKSDKSKVESNVFSIIIEQPQPVTDSFLLLGSSPPGLSWENNCNTQFKVWFVSENNPAKKKALSFKNPSPGDNGGISKVQLTPGQWTAINQLAGSSASNVNWYIESWDAMKRQGGKSREMTFMAEGKMKPLALEVYNYGQFFSIRKPKGWEVVVAGACDTLAFVIRDPNEPLRQIFYFTTVGPVYLNETQKQLDQYYIDHGGYNLITWLDAPVINPLTVENYFTHWPEIAGMKAAKSFMGDSFPKLENIEIISRLQQPNSIGIPGAETTLVRGVFADGDKPAEGQFLGSVWVFLPFMNTPGGGTAYGSFILGATAPKAEFPKLLPKLIESLESFTVSQGYVNWCLVQSNKIWNGVAEAGRTLSEASDIIYEGWKNRTQIDDIMAEERSDAMLDLERVYDPDTGNVYQFDAGWYSQYELDPNSYNLGNLQLLPDGDPHWLDSFLYGPGYIYLW
jgi:hypothetical protein